MKPADAASILGLSGELNPEVIKQAYRKACAKYHPDRNPAGTEMMKAVNLAYEALKEFEGDIKKEDVLDDFGDVLNDALNAVINLTGIEIEVCGAWIWLSGNTKEHKDTIKEAGFYWAPKKKRWYFRPANYQSRSRGTWSMDDIRDEYGSKKVRTQGPQLLNH